MPDARGKEFVQEDKRRSKRDTGAYMTGITGDLGDMGENDSLSG